MKGESVRQRLARICAPDDDEELLRLRKQLETKHPRTPLTRRALGQVHREIDERGLVPEGLEGE